MKSIIKLTWPVLTMGFGVSNYEVVLKVDTLTTIVN